MNQPELIEQELAEAEEALKIGNEGKARVLRNGLWRLPMMTACRNNPTGPFAGMPWRIFAGFSRICLCPFPCAKRQSV